MISVRGGAGLGDAIYVQGVVRHFVEQGQRIEVCTDWPDVFRPLEGKVRLSPFRRRPVDRVAHYAARRAIRSTTQFVDCCISAGIHERIPLRLDWMPVNVGLVKRLQSQDKPVVIVQMPRAPFGRTDGFGSEFLPDCSVIQRAIDLVKGRAYLVQVGHGQALYRFTGIDLDLTNKTSVSDVIDIGYAAQGSLGYCSFIIPLAECFSKPVQLVWSRRGLNSQHEVIRQMVPEKMLALPTSRAVVDDCSHEQLEEAMDAFCDALRHPATV